MRILAYRSPTTHLHLGLDEVGILDLNQSLQALGLPLAHLTPGALLRIEAQEDG